MQEPFPLDPRAIAALLRKRYRIDVARVEFLPLGNDAGSRSYRVVSRKGTDRFLKIRKGYPYDAATLVPQYLRDRGIEAVVAPIKTSDSSTRVVLGGYTLSLYPFLDGRNGMEIGLPVAGWRRFGEILRAIHSTPLPANLLHGIRLESFGPRYRTTIDALVRTVERYDDADACRREMIALWKERGEEIASIVVRTVELGRMVRERKPALVPCHADIHTANLVVDDAGGLHVVDWDGVILAPPERDLIFIPETSWNHFIEGYGAVTVDRECMAYYRYEWVVQEIADYGERVLLADDLGEETKRHAVLEFRRLFEPGEVVEAARNSGF